MNKKRETIKRLLSTFKTSDGKEFPSSKSYSDISRYQLTNYVSDPGLFIFSLFIKSSGKSGNNTPWGYPTKLSMAKILQFQEIVRELVYDDANNTDDFLGDFISGSDQDESMLSLTDADDELKLKSASGQDEHYMDNTSENHEQAVNTPSSRWPYPPEKKKGIFLSVGDTIS